MTFSVGTIGNASQNRHCLQEDEISRTDVRMIRARDQGIKFHSVTCMVAAQCTTESVVCGDANDSVANTRNAL